MFQFFFILDNAINTGMTITNKPSQATDFAPKLSIIHPPYNNARIPAKLPNTASVRLRAVFFNSSGTVSSVISRIVGSIMP